MAASFLLPFPSCINHSLCSEDAQKCKRKLYMVPSKAIASCWRLKLFANVGSVNAHVKREENCVCSNSSGPSDFSRYDDALPDHSGDGMSEFEKQLQDLFNEVKTLIKMGNMNDAIHLLQANYEAVKEQIDLGYKGLEEAAILDVILLGYMAIGDLKIVEFLVNKMNEIVEKLKDGEPLLDSILMHMASVYSALGKFEESVLMYRRVTNNLERIYGIHSNFLVMPLLGLAEALASIRQTTKAVESYHRVVSILEASRGAESEDLVLPLCALGNLLVKEGKATDSENAFVRIIEIYTKIYGKNDGRVGMAMCSLANAKCAKGNVDEAIKLYRSALEVIKDSDYMALDDSAMENMRIDLAELLHTVGRGKEGRELLEECLLITERSKGRDHPSSVRHLINLATSYMNSKNFVEAERILRTSLEIMKKTVSPDDPSITFPMLQLGVTLYHLNRDEEAKQIVQDVVHTREKAFGKDSLPVGEALDCLVSIQTRLGKEDAEVLELLKRVLVIQEKELGNESEEVMFTLKKLVFYLDKLGRKDEKFALQKRLSILKNKFKQKVQY